MTDIAHDRGAPLPSPGAHGGDGAALGRALGVPTSEIIDLSASLNPFAPPVAAMAAALLHREPDTLRAYPDAGPATAALAKAMNVDPTRLVLTNGGAEAIALLAGLAPVGWVEDPEFSLYRRHLAEVRPGTARWRSNPSNPLGRLAQPQDHAEVWDEAFYPLATGQWTRGEDHGWRLGSLTKLWACPGLRAGYLIAPDAHQAQQIRSRQPRWSVNGLALAMMEPLLALTDLPGWHAAMVNARSAFGAALRRLGFDVTETEATWLLVSDPHGDLRARLAAHRLLVRDTTNFGLPGLIRVALPEPARIELAVAAFTEVSNPASPGRDAKPGATAVTG
ncbi:MAG: aminotransferase class I/II-fold pyridoxal phosphate-dependent enzyme [Acidimicrobiales bacterium]